MKRFLKSSLSLILAITIIFSSAYVGLSEIDFGGILAVAADTSYAVGDIVEFGTYKQNAIKNKNGETTGFDTVPIQWRIIKIENGKALLLSEKIIDTKQYNSTSATVDGYYGNNYAHSDIREWLINDFYNTAFSSAEKKRIVATTLDNSAAPTDVNASGSYTKYSSESTTDKVFLLSKDEANSYASKYFGATATDYAYANGYTEYSGAGSKLGARWLLRTAGNNTFQIYYVHVRWGKYTTYFNWNDDSIQMLMGVRPAIYVDLENFQETVIDDSYVMQAGMPTLSHQDAVNFLSFLYNQKDGFKDVDITSDIQYQLLTGNLPDDMTVDEIKGLIVAFLCVVERLTNAQINEYKYKTNYLYEVLVARLEEEVGGMSNLDEQIINQEMGRFSKIVEDGLVDIGTGIISRTTGIIFTEEVFENIGNVLSGIGKATDVASKIKDMVNYTIDGVLLYGMALGQENVARVSYFNSYINLRGLNETAFRAGIDCAFDTLAMSYPLSKLLDLLTWFTKKDSWTNHRADIDRWAECVYQLGQYQKKDFHQYNSTEYPATCTVDGYTLCECIYCDKSFNANIVKAPGHKYIKTTVAPLCEEEGYDLYKCKVCGDSYQENYKKVLGHLVFKQETIAPTCVDAGYTINYCKCGYEWLTDEKAELHHSYVSTVVEPTETKQGYTVNNCSICGDSYYSDYVNPKGHSYTVTETAPTCESNGTIIHTCDCGEFYAEEIPTKGHHYVLESFSVPTCTQQGVKTYKCRNCNSSYTESVDVIPHDYTYKIVITEPTCNEQGYCTNYCSCGATSVTDYVETSGHTYEINSTVDATCTSEGSVTTECTVCGHKYTETIPALGNGHDYKLIEFTSLGCVTSQYELYECSQCGIQKYENIVVAEGHTYDTCETVSPTCTHDGSRTFYCTTCNETITEILPKTNHDKNEWEPSDSGMENEMVRKCKICGIIVEKSSDIRTIEWYVNDQHIVDYLPVGCVIAPPQTIGADGYKFSHWYPKTPPLAIGEENLKFTAVYSNEPDKIYVVDDFSFEYDVDSNTAGICGYLGSEEQVLLPEKILDFNVTSIGANAIPANVTQVTIPETITNIHPQAFNSATKLQKINVVENNNFYTAIDGVLYSKDETELVRLPIAYQGNFEFAENITTIGECAFNGHKLSEEFNIPESITTIEKSAFSKCTGIKYVFYTGTEEEWSKISIGSDNACLTNAYVHYETTEHIYSEEWTVDVAPTCTKVGSKSHKCNFCDSRIEVTEVPATGHNYSSVWTTDLAPTCTKDGSKSHHCIVCDDKADITSIDALGHDYSTEWTIDIAVTCITDGSKSRHCTVCDDKIEITAIVAPGHSYSEDWIIDLEATCTENGSKSYHCAVCGDKKDVTVIPAPGHNYSTEWTIDLAPTCTEEGSKSYHCLGCDDKKDITVIPANGHSYGDWVIDLEATCTEDGSRSKTCTGCNDLISETIITTGHDYSDEWTIDFAPTCIKNGYKSRHCTKCEDKTDEIVISPLGHSYGNAVIEREPTCTKTGSRYKVCSACNRKSTEVIPALGHSFSEEWTIDIPATCTTTGQKSHHCTDCDAKTDFTVIDATGHNYVTTVEPTHPHTTTKKCSFCNDEHTEVPYVSNCVECNFTVAALDANSYKLVSYIGTGANVVVPTEYNGLLITKIEANCFKGNTTIKSVVIPEGVTSMGNAVFYGCAKLESVTIPSTVTNTGNAAFYNCTSLKSVKIADGVKTIGNSAFRGCTSLESITIPESVTTIGAQAFYGFTGTIYCTKDSTAHNYAVANNIKFAFIEDIPITATENSQIDYENHIVKTNIQSCDDIAEVLAVSDSARIVVTASCKQGSIELLGTGTVISVHEGDTLIGDYTLVVNGDTDGDSICDVLDCAQVELASNSNTNLSRAYAMAADSNSDEMVDITDYQAIVNKALAS